MAVRNTRDRWGLVSKCFHWLTAILIIFMIILGVVMTELVSPGTNLQFVLYQTHKSVGFTVLALTLLRLGWRLANPVPVMPASMPLAERFIAFAAHVAMYIFLIAIPLSGWFLTSASAYAEFIPTKLYGLIEIPHLISPNEVTFRKLLGLHQILVITLGGMLVLHVVAAMKHHFLNRDEVFRRMLPDRIAQRVPDAPAVREPGA